MSSTGSRKPDADKQSRVPLCQILERLAPEGVCCFCPLRYHVFGKDQNERIRLAECLLHLLMSFKFRKKIRISLACPSEMCIDRLPAFREGRWFIEAVRKSC